MSVIIPAYNAQGYIERCVRSVLTQTYRHFEVLVINDGSIDNTLEALKPVADSIRLYCQDNTGVSSARNLGIEKAQGDWIAFLDADDYWKPRRLERAVALTSGEPGADFLHSNFVHSDTNGNESPASRDMTKSQLQDRKILASGWLLPTSTVMLSRPLLNRMDSHFSTLLKTCEDYEFFWRLLFAAGSVLYEENADVVHIAEPGSLSRDESGHRRSQDRDLLIDNVKAMGMAARWMDSKDQACELAECLRARQRWKLRQLLLADLAGGSIRSAVGDAVFGLEYLRPTEVLAAIIGAAKRFIMNRGSSDR